MRVRRERDPCALSVQRAYSVRAFRNAAPTGIETAVPCAYPSRRARKKLLRGAFISTGKESTFRRNSYHKKGLAYWKSSRLLPLCILCNAREDCNGYAQKRNLFFRFDNGVANATKNCDLTFVAKESDSLKSLFE